MAQVRSAAKEFLRFLRFCQWRASTCIELQGADQHNHCIKMHRSEGYSSSPVVNNISVATSLLYVSAGGACSLPPGCEGTPPPTSCCSSSPAPHLHACASRVAWWAAQVPVQGGSRYRATR
jgi:hypothetical protein